MYQNKKGILCESISQYRYIRTQDFAFQCHFRFRDAFVLELNLLLVVM